MQNPNPFRAADRRMSMPAFFDYLAHHSATTDLAKALGEVAMLRTCGAGSGARTTHRERAAS